MIFVECNTEETLAKQFGFGKKEIIHSGSGGKSKVCKRLEKAVKSKALVDEEYPTANKPPYQTKLVQIDNKHNIKVLYDKKKQNRLIMLCPRFEEWILEAAKVAGVKMENYGLPDDADKLHNIINFKLPALERLITDIKPTVMLKTLHEFLRK